MPGAAEYVKPASILILCLWGLLSIKTAYSQQPENLQITEAYQLARSNYPLIREKDLISKTREYSVSNAAKGYLPALSINGQATYQSAVSSLPFKIPIPGFVFPNYNKDQYKIYAELDQLIYDGGIIKNQRESAKANESVQQQNLEVELYALYDRVNQLFFGAMLINEQLNQNTLLQKDIQNGLDKTKALLTNGLVYRSSVDELAAQLLQAQQTRIELLAAKKAYLEMLGFFMNKPLSENTILVKQSAPAQQTDSISRPELLFYDYQKKTYNLQAQLLNAQLMPKFSFYIQGGYGRPGLNFLNNNFAWYYSSGLKLNWNLGSLYTLKNQKKLLNLSKDGLDVQKETFLFNTRLLQKQQQTDIQKYTELIEKDQSIISLRQSVKNAALAQLDNGVLSAHDYINQVIAEDQARQNLILHEVQLLQAQYSYQSTIGNIRVH